VVDDVETIAGAKDVAAQVNGLGHFDALIHNDHSGFKRNQIMVANSRSRKRYRWTRHIAPSMESGGFRQPTISRLPDSRRHQLSAIAPHPRPS
jgi:hypothetical protein